MRAAATLYVAQREEEGREAQPDGGDAPGATTIPVHRTHFADGGYTGRKMAMTV